MTTSIFTPFNSANSADNEAQYKALRRQFILAGEGTSSGVYLDSVGIPTMGIGLNLQSGDNIERFVQSEYGLNEPAPEVDLDPSGYARWNEFIQSVRTEVGKDYGPGGTLENRTGPEIALQATLDGLLRQYLAESGHPNPNAEFSFRRETTATEKQGEINAQAFFDNTDIADSFELSLVKGLIAEGILPEDATAQSVYSPEFLALWDIAYNVGVPPRQDSCRPCCSHI